MLIVDSTVGFHGFFLFYLDCSVDPLCFLVSCLVISFGMFCGDLVTSVLCLVVSPYFLCLTEQCEHRSSAEA